MVASPAFPTVRVAATTGRVTGLLAGPAAVTGRTDAPTSPPDAPRIARTLWL
jgi:hypothetical protein